MTSVKRPIRLVIVDDHPVVRDGLCAIFAEEPGFEVVGEAVDGVNAVELVSRLRPDVVLMDLRMPRLGGAAAIAQLRDAGFPGHVLVLTTFDADNDVLSAIEAGATGYVLKDTARAELLRAVNSAARGESVLSPSVAGRLIGQIRSPAGGAAMSNRELEVLSIIARGKTNKEAAAQLFISEATVKTHMLHIFAKLGVSDRTSAVAVAIDRGLLRLDP